MDFWLNKLLYTHIMKYYASAKINKKAIYELIWSDLQNTYLEVERSYMHKIIYSNLLFSKKKNHNKKM